MNVTALIEQFKARCRAAPRVYRAPGRVNLIGEHTDYNDGFVMPAAIEFSTCVAMAPRMGRRLSVGSLTLDQSFEIDLSERAPPRHDWTDYVAGVAYTLQDEGLELAGADLLIDSDVPLGAGLSSSAALEVSVAHALLAASGLQRETLSIALACQRAENEFVGVRSGIMDQFASCFGREGHALLIDCRKLEHHSLTIPPGVSLVICNTMVKHELSGGEYNKRRADCEEASRLLRVRALRDIQPDEFARRAVELPGRIRARARHVVSENARVEQAARALASHDLTAFGRLMNESHQSLHDDYEVTCPELDAMAALAREVPGVYGARMTGGGFGGCTINLVEHNAVDRVRETVAAGYRKQFSIEPEIYVTRAAAGAGEVAAV
jgi:galactokinase